MDELINLIESGTPEFRHEFPPQLREYFQFREHLYTIDGVIIYKDRIVIPPSLRDEVLCALHAAHQGVTTMISRTESSNGAAGLITCLRRTFVTFEIPDELASDGGPEFNSSATRHFLRDWGLYHRLSSVSFPHSNCRTEVGVKTVKRMIADNTGPKGDLDTDAFQRAMLQYRNTPESDTKLSPAMCVFGHPIRDFIPIPPEDILLTILEGKL
ncbi:unnamed protein product [Mytilus edulis]|uniref:Integrase catalytic domain-containing protein n=1 Tax=Mytilus edulis TaxID=6550 RepID=A0A8S3SRW4_MYTED|nr:unnamed protein product [Mytilus edulis]